MDIFNKLLDSLLSASHQISDFLIKFFKGFGNMTQMFNEAQKVINFINDWLAENVTVYVKPIFYYLVNILAWAFDYIFNFIKNLVNRM